MYIIIAIIVFGLLIATHEFGHFIAAKACGVKVLEFAIGMGPALFKRQGKETLYSLRVLPIGGYCAMEGEDEESPDPRAFTSAKWWKRLIILAAGSFMNLLLGFIVVLCLYSGTQEFVVPVVSATVEEPWADFRMAASRKGKKMPMEPRAIRMMVTMMVSSALKPPGSLP